MFHVGQKVVCVDAHTPSSLGWDARETPVEGKNYTVRRVFVWHDGTPVVWLDELARSVWSRFQHGEDAGYAAWRFRPVKDTTQQVEKLKRILLPKRQRERA